MTVAEFINAIGFKIKEDDVKKVNTKITDIKNTATKILGAIGIGFSLTAINGLVEEFGRVNDQIKNATNSLENQHDVQQKILASAAKTRSQYGDTAKIVTNLVQENSDLFGTIDEAVNFNNAATMLFKSAGKTNEEIAGLMEAINKSFAKGVVDSETLNQLMERSPEAVALLNNRLGTTTDQLTKLASEGKIGLTDLKGAFVDNIDAIEAGFSNVKMRVTDALTVIRNKWGLWLAETNEMLGVTDSLGNVMVRAFNGAMKAVNRVRDSIMWLSDKVGGMNNLFKLVAITVGSIVTVMNWSKILNGLTAIKNLILSINLTTLKTIAIVILVALVIEDFINFLMGNDSLMGHFFDKMGINAEEVRTNIKNTFEKIKQFLGTVWNGIKSVVQSVWNRIVSIGKSIWNGFSGYFKQHGEDTKKKLTEAWNSILGNIKEIWNTLKGTVEEVFDKINSFLEEHGTSIQDIFTKIGEAVGGVIDFFVQLTSTIAEIGFEILSEAVKVCTDVFTGLVDIVMSAIDFFAEHKTLTEVLAIAVGTLTAAIIAYNVAQAIKNAGGIVEIAQLAAIAIGLAGLTVAETAHTVATTVATAATTAFGAAMAFLTSPITLIILAIGALIAIVVVIIKYWDEIANAAKSAWEWIKGIWSNVANWFDQNIIQPIVGFFTGLWDSITGVFQGVIDWIKTNWKAIVAFILNPFAGIFKYLYDNFEGFRNFVDNVVQKIKDFFAGLWDGIKNIWGNVVEFFSSVFTAAWEGIKTAWDAVVTFFVSIWNGIVSVFSVVGEWFSGIFSSAWEGIKNAFSAVGSFFTGIWDGIKNIFTKIGTTIGDGISGAFKSVVNSVINFASKVINGFIDSINWAIGVINNIPGVNIKKLARVELKGLAEGGYIGANKPTPVVIGDNKSEGEIVSPISKMRDTLLEALRIFASAYRPTDSARVLTAEAGNRVITQNIEINNQFNGDRPVQQKAAVAMDKAAKDCTSELARAIAFAG